MRAETLLPPGTIRAIESRTTTTIIIIIIIIIIINLISPEFTGV
jgi:hypothetical protein